MRKRHLLDDPTTITKFGISFSEDFFNSLLNDEVELKAFEKREVRGLKNVWEGLKWTRHLIGNTTGKGKGGGPSQENTDAPEPTEDTTS